MEVLEDMMVIVIVVIFLIAVDPGAFLGGRIQLSFGFANVALSMAYSKAKSDVRQKFAG